MSASVSSPSESRPRKLQIREESGVQERVEEVKIQRMKITVPMLYKDLDGEGLPKNTIILLTGDPGSGKTSLAIRLIPDAIRQGMIPVYISSEMSSDEVLGQAQSLKIDIPRFRDFRLDKLDQLDLGSPIFLDVFTFREIAREISEQRKESGKESVFVSATSPQVFQEAFEEVLGWARERAREENRRYVDLFVIADSISTYISAAPVQARRFGVDLLATMRKYTFRDKEGKNPQIYTTLIAISQVSSTTGTTFGFPLEHIAGGVIEFKVIRPSREGEELKRIAYIKKMRYTRHYLGAYRVLIGEQVEGQYHPVYFKR
jgi:KaiC/GvpD/RAD55 family RecA-like ATPase